MTMVAPSQVFDRDLSTSRQSGAVPDETAMKRGLAVLMADDKPLIDFLKELSLDGLWMWDLETPNRGWMSARLWELLGYAPGETAYQAGNWVALLDPETGKDATARFAAYCAAPDHPYDEVLRFLHRDGSAVWLHCRGLAVRDAGGKPVRLLGAHTDITALKRVEEELLRGQADLTHRLAKSSEANAWLEMAEQIGRIGHWRLTLSDRSLVWSTEMYRIHGVTPQTYAPTMETAIAFTHPDDLERVEAAVANAIHAARPFEFSARLISAQGVLRHVNCRGVTRLEVDGRVGMVVGVVADLTAQRETERALREANRQLEALANVDSLTGIANRRRFDEILALEWRRAERERMPLSLVMLDIDRFKGFNDRYGHLAGDECLRRVAGVLAERGRRAADIAARYGGEEMVLLLPATTASGAEIIARECRSAIAALGISHEGNMSCGGVVTASFGVATAILPDESGFPACTDLVAEADRQLYEAKRTGRNKVMTPQTAVSDGASLLPPDEERRLAELARYEATGAGRRTQEMDGIARLAATLSGTPIALVSLVTRDLKLFIGNFNVPGTDSLPRDISFCQHTILGDEPMVVADATRDMRFKENPLVTGDFGLRYYAGAPIVSQGTGHKLGTLCVVDTVARERTSVAERAVLTDLAAMVAALLEDNLKSAEG